MLIRLAIVAAVAALCSVCSAGIDPGRLVVWIPCASACAPDRPPAPDNPLCFSFGLEKRGGWSRLIAERVRPAYDLGYRRFVFHLPWGNEYAPGPMPLDAVDDLIEENMAWVLVEWRAAIVAAAEAMPDAEFIHYVGSARDLDLAALDDAGDRFGHAGRIFRSLQPLLGIPQISVAFDHSSTYEPGSAAWAWVRLVAAYKAQDGVATYMEAYPEAGVEPVLPASIVLEDFHNFDMMRGGGRFAAAKAAGGEVIRGLIASAADEPDEWGWAAGVVRDGSVPALPWWGDRPWIGMPAAEVASKISAIADYDGLEIVLAVVGGPGAVAFEPEIYRRLRELGYPIAPGVACVAIDAGTSADPASLAASDPDFPESVFRSRVQSAVRQQGRKAMAFVDYRGWDSSGSTVAFGETEAGVVSRMLAEVRRAGFEASVWDLPAIGPSHPGLDLSSLASAGLVNDRVPMDWACVSGATRRGRVSSGEADPGDFLARLSVPIAEIRGRLPGVPVYLVYEAFETSAGAGGRPTMLAYAPEDAYHWGRAALASGVDGVLWRFQAADSSSGRAMLDMQLRQAEALAEEFVRGITESARP